MSRGDKPGAQDVRIAEASIRLDSMPVAGRELKLALGEAERAAIAAFLALTAVDRLEVTLHAVKFRGGIRVTGRLRAAIVQPSVVTLEPVHQEISEPIDRIFLPGAEKQFAGEADAEIFVDLDGEDVPDHFDGNEADLSALIVETLALAIDPYPRTDNDRIEDLGAVLDADTDNRSPRSRR